MRRHVTLYLDVRIIESLHASMADANKNERRAWRAKYELSAESWKAERSKVALVVVTGGRIDRSSIVTPVDSCGHDARVHGLTGVTNVCKVSGRVFAHRPDQRMACDRFKGSRTRG